MACDVATGITFGMAASTFTAEIVDFSPIFEQTVEDVDCTHQGSTAREFVPSDLIDAGECTMTINFTVGVAVPVGNAPEQCTITFPIVNSSNTTNGTWVCDGYIKSFSATGVLENKQEGEVTVKWTGAGTLTDESA